MVRTLGDTYMFFAVYFGKTKIKILNKLFLEYHAILFFYLTLSFVSLTR